MPATKQWTRVLAIAAAFITSIQCAWAVPGYRGFLFDGRDVQAMGPYNVAHDDVQCASYIGIPSTPIHSNMNETALLEERVAIAEEFFELAFETCANIQSEVAEQTRILVGWEYLSMRGISQFAGDNDPAVLNWFWRELLSSFEDDYSTSTVVEFTCTPDARCRRTSQADVPVGPSSYRLSGPNQSIELEPGLSVELIGQAHQTVKRKKQQYFTYITDVPVEDTARIDELSILLVEQLLGSEFRKRSYRSVTVYALNQRPDDRFHFPQYHRVRLFPERR
ncbi:MAG: hypothetical protein AAGC81_19815 [Pseudomonadota bacterium]